jgi:hypothetical protein
VRAGVAPFGRLHFVAQRASDRAADCYIGMRCGGAAVMRNLPRLPSFVERVDLTPQVKLDLHLRRYPHSGNSELFLLNGLAGTDRDLPRIVHAVEKHGHFRRPWPELRRPLLNQRRELFRRSFGFSHAAGSLIGNVN